MGPSRQLDENPALVRLGPPISLDFTLLNPGDKAYLALHITLATKEAFRTFINAIDGPALKQLSLYTRNNLQSTKSPQIADLKRDRISNIIVVLLKSPIWGPLVVGDLLEYAHSSSGSGAEAVMRTTSTDGSCLTRYLAPDVVAELVPERGMRSFLAHCQPSFLLSKL